MVPSAGRFTPVFVTAASSYVRFLLKWCKFLKVQGVRQQILRAKSASSGHLVSPEFYTSRHAGSSPESVCGLCALHNTGPI